MSTPETFDIGLSLLDRQLIGSKDELLGNVDNAVLETVAGELAVTALVTGPAGLAPRFGGRVEVWMSAIWRRLRPETAPTPVLIPMTHVVDLGAVITLDDQAQQRIADGAQLERWLRHYLIKRIPGATGGPDRLAGEPLGPVAPQADRAPTPPLNDTHLVSDLIGAAVVDPHGRHLGVVLDLCADPPHPGRHRVGPLPIRAVLYGQRHLGAEMGYTTQQDQGPWIIAAPLRAWHHADRIAPLDDLIIDWHERTVSVARPAHLRHPHQAP
jgi:sporulation protein YlmC with PRC-barrel domain